MKLLAQLMHLSYVDKHSHRYYLKMPTKVFLARLLLGFMLVWLPLQGYAVEVMSTCQRHHDHAIATENTEHAGCHGAHDSAAQPPAFAKANLACDDCASCHLISQPALVMKPLFIGLENIQPQRFIYSVNFSAFFPEQPQRPPLTFFS